MANRYWIASTQQNWNSTANWSTSTGGSSGASVPTSSDTAIFDSNGLGRCVINTSATWGAFTKTAGDVYLNYNKTLTINGAFSHTGGDFTIQSRPNYEYNEQGFLVVFGNFTESTSGTFQCNDGIINIYGNTTTGTGFYCRNATIALYGLSKTFACNSSADENKLHRLIIEGIITCNSLLTFYTSTSELIINGAFTYSNDTLSVQNFMFFGTLEMTAVGTKLLIVYQNFSHFFGEVIGEISLILKGSSSVLAPDDYSVFNLVNFQNDQNIVGSHTLVEGGDYTFRYMGVGCDGANFDFNFNGATVTVQTLTSIVSSNLLTVNTNGATINVINNPDIGLGYISLVGNIYWNGHIDGSIKAIDRSAFVLATDHNDTNVYDNIIALDGVIIRANPDEEDTTPIQFTCFGLNIKTLGAFTLTNINSLNDFIVSGGIYLTNTNTITVGGDFSVIGDPLTISEFNGTYINVGGEANVEYGIASSSNASDGSTIKSKFVYNAGNNDNWDFENKITILNPTNFKSAYTYNISNKGIALKEVSAQIGVELISYPANTSLKFYGKSSSQSSYSLLKYVNAIGGDGKFTYNWECRQQGQSYQWYIEISNYISIYNTLVQEFTVPHATKDNSMVSIDCKDTNLSVSTGKLLVRPNFGKSGGGAYISANLLSRIAKHR